MGFRSLQIAPKNEAVLRGFENRVEYGELPLHISAVFPGPLACDDMREWYSDHSVWSAHLEHCFRKALRDNYPTIKATLSLLSLFLIQL